LVAALLMDLDRILELLAKQMGNLASENEITELEYLLEQYPDHTHLVSILRSVQSKKLRQPAQNEELIVREGWEKLQEKMRAIGLPDEAVKNRQKTTFLSLWAKDTIKWAAVVVTAVGLFLLSYLNVSNSHSSKNIAAVQEVIPSGKPGMKTLPDGSVVWINAGSKIRYKAEQNTRDVYLEGEAYFKVKHDTEHPFVVHAGNISVRALGTEFNVSAYPGDDHVETTLIKGKVQVTMEERPDQKIILVPNEKLTVTNKLVTEKDAFQQTGISYEVKPVEINTAVREVGEIAWMQDKLAFQNEPFSELAKKMERRYNVHIVFQDESLKNETLSGIFANETIQKALGVLQMTTPFKYRMKADSIYLNRP
jgi:transmembrane sensor